MAGHNKKGEPPKMMNETFTVYGKVTKKRGKRRLDVCDVASKARPSTRGCRQA
jgi:hypothetical protein